MEELCKVSGSIDGEKATRWKIQSIWLWLLKSYLVVVVVVQFSWLRCWWALGGQYFLGIYGQFTKCLWISDICSPLLILLTFSTWGICACSGQIVLLIKLGVIQSTGLGKAAPQQRSVLLPEPYLGSGSY